jgi:hypothetical protein
VRNTLLLCQAPKGYPSVEVLQQKLAFIRRQNTEHRPSKARLLLMLYRLSNRTEFRACDQTELLGRSALRLSLAHSVYRNVSRDGQSDPSGRRGVQLRVPLKNSRDCLGDEVVFEISKSRECTGTAQLAEDVIRREHASFLSVFLPSVFGFKWGLFRKFPAKG